MTYNQIIKLLRDFSEAHFVLKSFGNGEPWELVENSQRLDLEYPMMWAQDLPNTVVKGEEAFKFRMYFLGQVATVKEKTETTLGETNVNEVKSDMRQCATDLASYLIQDKNYPDIDSTRDLNLTSFVDDFNDKLTGWYFDLTITQSFSFSACDIPMDGIIPPPSGECLPTTILINGVSFSSVPSGDTEDIIVKDTNGLAVGSKVSNEWIVPAEGAVCLDATQIIKDSDNVILYTNNISSGTSEDQVITDSPITNSNATFNDKVKAQDTYIITDTTYEVYLDGVLKSTINLPSQVNQTININWI